MAFENVLKTEGGRSAFHVQEDGVSLLGGVAHGRSPAENQASYRMGVREMMARSNSEVRL